MNTRVWFPGSARALWRWLKRFLRLVFRFGFGVGALLVLWVLMGEGTLDGASLGARVTAQVRDHLFDFVGWEVDALWGKAHQELFGVQSYLDEETRSDQVLAYLERLIQAQKLEAQVEAIYADPAITDPGAATTSLRADRDALRHTLAGQQPLVESIIEEQVSAVLAGEGFATLGQVLPPVSMHFSESPLVLIVSPRDHIEFAVDRHLNTLTIEERTALEDHIDTELDVASLIAPLGGLSLYPSMIVEPGSYDLPGKLARTFEVTAHEWAHHYLIFFPLGWDYDAHPETRIINETTATFFGREIARKVIERYYPDIPPPFYPSFLTGDVTSPAPPETPTLPRAERHYDPDAVPPFDYAAEMHHTRLWVDLLLGQGQVELAEQYMEGRRRVFLAHGYMIRKLNQAYFAFYGGYQATPGAGGTDPIGPAIESLRALCPTLRGWMQTLRGITMRDELLVAVERAGGE